MIVPKGHALETVKPLTLEAIAEWPIITYHEGFTGRGTHRSRPSPLPGCAPDVVMSAMDTDVLKAYVELGPRRRHHRRHGASIRSAMRACDSSMARICSRPTPR